MSKSKATPKIIEHYLALIVGSYGYTVNNDYSNYTISVESAVSDDFVIQGFDNDDWVAAYIVRVKVEISTKSHNEIIHDITNFLCELFLQRNVFTKLVIS